MGTGAVKIQNDNKSTINVLLIYSPIITCTTFFFGTQKENIWRMLYEVNGDWVGQAPKKAL